jgi:hypothetical protein
MYVAGLTFLFIFRIYSYVLSFVFFIKWTHTKCIPSTYNLHNTLNGQIVRGHQWCRTNSQCMRILILVNQKVFVYYQRITSFFSFVFFQINIHIAIGYWSDTSYIFFLNSNILYCIRMFFCNMNHCNDSSPCWDLDWTIKSYLILSYTMDKPRHWSERWTFRRVNSQKGQWSEWSIVRRVNGPKGQ